MLSMKIVGCLFFLVLASGCGVKGKPLPPLQLAPIGDGTLRANKKKPAQKPVDSTPVEEHKRADENEL